MSRLVPVIYAFAAASLSAAYPQQDACDRISSQFPGAVSYPESTIYESSNSYYSGQERGLSPGCIFKPTCTQEVAKFVKSVTKYNDTQFAIRGGGHTLWTGAANINGGITVDMRLMNETKVSSNWETASLGAGGLYNLVYPQLEEYNLTVMGGRVPGIGVGGFATGGECSPNFESLCTFPMQPKANCVTTRRHDLPLT
jgi:FAD/FMN-containing dehydrogenase